MMPESYQLIERPPTLEEYRKITFAVGWEEFTNFDAVQTALNYSLYHIVALYEDETVGMGRIVGDGAMFYYLQDIAVVPDHRGKGVGTMIIDRLMAYVQVHAPDNAFINLFATPDAISIYKRYGFEVSSGLVGMVRRLRK